MCLFFFILDFLITKIPGNDCFREEFDGFPDGSEIESEASVSHAIFSAQNSPFTQIIDVGRNSRLLLFSQIEVRS